MRYTAKSKAVTVYWTGLLDWNSGVDWTTALNDFSIWATLCVCVCVCVCVCACVCVCVCLCMFSDTLK